MSINSRDRPWPQTLGHDDLEWPAGENRVLVPFHEAVNLHETGLLGASVAFGSDGELYVLHSVEADGGPDPDETRETAELKLEVDDRFDVPVVQTTTDGSLGRFVDAHGITTTVVDRAESRFFRGARPDDGVPRGCHTVVGRGMDRFTDPASVLVPVARGPHSGLAVRVAEAVASAFDCWLELFHVAPEHASEATELDAGRLLDAYEYRIGDESVDVDTQVVRAPDPADAIVEHAGYHDLAVLGAPEKGKLRRFLFGSTVDQVTDAVGRTPVLTAHRHGVESLVSRWV